MIRTCPKCQKLHNRNHSYCNECHAAYVREWRQTHPLSEMAQMKANARSYANVYLKRGKLTKGPCEDCGVEEAEMHHEDYSRPLEVTWLCRQCHLDRHHDAGLGCDSVQPLWVRWPGIMSGA
jgi:hypothetical protein